MFKKLEKRSIHFAHSWDWKAQANWGDVEKSIIELMDEDFKPHFYYMETGDDEHGLLISSESMFDAQAQSVFAEIYNLPES